MCVSVSLRGGDKGKRPTQTGSLFFFSRHFCQTVFTPHLWTVALRANRHLIKSVTFYKEMGKKKAGHTFILSLAFLLVNIQVIICHSSSCLKGLPLSTLDRGKKKKKKNFKMKVMDIACRRGKSKVHHLLGNAFLGHLHQAASCALKKEKKKKKKLVEMTFLETVFLRFYDLLLTFYCM